GFVEAEVMRVGRTSDGKKNVSAGDLRRALAAFHADRDATVVSCERYAFGVQAKLDALKLHDLLNGFRNVLVFAADQAWAHLDDCDFAAEAPVHLTEFQTDVAAADNDEVFGQKINIHHRGVVEKWYVVNAGKRGNRSAAANVDEDFFGLENLIVDDD